MGLFDRLFGKDESRSEVSTEQIEFEGFTIKPAPLKQKNAYVTAGYIYKPDDTGEMREHYFIRADTHVDFKSAYDHTVFKAKQIIDESGVRIFDKN